MMEKYTEIAKLLEKLEQEGAGEKILESGRDFLKTFGHARRQGLTRFRMGLFIQGIPVVFGMSKYALEYSFPEIKEKNRGRKARVDYLYAKEEGSIYKRVGFSVFWKEGRGLTPRQYVFRTKSAF